MESGREFAVVDAASRHNLYPDPPICVRSNLTSLLRRRRRRRRRLRRTKSCLPKVKYIARNEVATIVPDMVRTVVEPAEMICLCKWSSSYFKAVGSMIV